VNLTDEFHVQTDGSLIAVRAVLAALLKNHPEPQKLLDDIRSILQQPGARDGQLPAPIQAVFDERMEEFTSHLRSRLGAGGKQA